MSMNDIIRAMVVDDHPLFREGVVHALSTGPDITVVGEASSGEEALAMVSELMPDVILLDLSMRGWDGLSTIQKIAMACPAAAVLILTASEDKDTLLAAFKAGASAYVLKGVGAGELQQIVRAVDRGEVYVSPSLAAEILVSMNRHPAPDPLQELTLREHEILGFIGGGLTNREIGERLQLSEKTIKHYVTNILQKLQVRSRVEAALLAAKRVVPK